MFESSHESGAKIYFFHMTKAMHAHRLIKWNCKAKRKHVLKQVKDTSSKTNKMLTSGWQVTPKSPPPLQLDRSEAFKVFFPDSQALPSLDQIIQE